MIKRQNKMKNKKYHVVGYVPKSQEEAKPTHLSHKYMTADFLGLAHFNKS
jgi:hypothetical protein